MTKAEGRFEGFADAGGSFFKKLAKNQNKEWFTAHKAEYEEGWQAPLQALLAEVAQKIDAAYPDCEIGEPKVFRIFRDVRFSKDKSPYKTHVSGNVPLKGAGGLGEVPSAFYFHVGAGELFAGAGLYMMDPARLAKLRAAILDDEKGGEIAKIVRALEKKGMRLTAAETLKEAAEGRARRSPADRPAPQEGPRRRRRGPAARRAHEPRARRPVRQGGEEHGPDGPLARLLRVTRPD